MSDVVVVGSGAAGLVAALHAAARGAKVTVLERAPVFGGTTAMSGGGMWVPLNMLGINTFGLKDSPDEVLQYLDSLTLSLVSRRTLEAFVAASPDFVDWLIPSVACEVMAADIPDYYQGKPGAKGPGRAITIGLYDTNRLGDAKSLLRVPYRPAPDAIRSNEERDEGWNKSRRLFDLANERRAMGIAARGRAFVGAMLEALISKGVELIPNARALDAVERDGRIVGVRAQRDARLETYDAKLGVVLGAGGFEWNRMLWNSHIGVPLDGPASPPWNEGDGLKIALRAGARYGNQGQVWWHSGLAIPGETYDGKPRVRVNAIRSRPGVIVVNRNGKRFMNEALPYNDVGRPVTQFDAHTYTFPNYPAFNILDSETFAREPLLPGDFNTPIDPSWCSAAPTLRGLAEKVGVDPRGLEEQVNDWNRSCDKGVDTAFHRGEKAVDLTRDAWETTKNDKTAGVHNGLLRPVARGPSYAVQLRTVCFGTKAGPVIDENAQVVDFDDRPIPGLFAAGNTTGSIFGHSYPGGGATIGAAAVMGWVAARTLTS